MEITNRPWIVMVALAIVAQVLFSYGVTSVDHKIFDEVHYVTAAEHLIALDAPVNTEHPLAGKTLIAASMSLFGDNALGWRAFSTLGGTACILGVFVMAFALFRNATIAAGASIMAMVNGFLFIQARIGMPDIFLGMFIIWGFALAALAARATNPMKFIVGSGVMMGLATATKWMAAPLIAGLCVAILLIRRNDIRDKGEEGQALHFGGMSVNVLVLILGSISILTYFLTFWPAFLYERDSLNGLGDLIDLQSRMYDLQTQILPSHPYQSNWMSWALSERPVWYLFEANEGGQRGIIMLGNPAVILLGIGALVWAFSQWWTNGDRKQAATIAMWAFSWGIFALIPKSLGFIYYYFPASLFFSVMIAGSFANTKHQTKKLGAACALAIAGFAMFYPIYSGMTVENGWYDHLMWLDSWR
jgi:dolichyl-phosphate-mannose--protein O-mannosyl transferase